MSKSAASRHGFRMRDFSLRRLLGGIPSSTFLAEYWQKRPLLVRQALPGFGDWLDRHLSEPKAHVFFDPPTRPLSPAAFARRVALPGD